MSQVSDTPEVTEQHLEEIESLFVQTAHGLITTDGTITSEDALAVDACTSPTGRSAKVGHMSSEHFVNVWSGRVQRTASPTTRPTPSSPTSILPHDFPEDTVVVLRDPRLEGGDLTYSVEALDGTLP